MADSRKEQERAELYRNIWNMAYALHGSMTLDARSGTSIKMGDMMGMLPVLLKMKRLSNMAAVEYAAEFKSPALRAFLGSITGEETNSIGVVATLATITSGDGGYPKGGSPAMALGITKRFEALGGKIIYKTRVDKVIMENGCSKGVVIDGKEISADAVIVTQDTMTAIDRLFDKPLNEPWMQEMRKDTLPHL